MLVCKVVLIPPHPVNHFTGLRLIFFNIATTAFNHFCDGSNTLKSNGSQRDTRVKEVLVRVIKTRNNRAALSIVQIFVARTGCADFLFSTDRCDLAVIAH